MKLSRAFVPYLNISARLAGAPDQDMLRKKGGTGFPYVIFMSPTGKPLNELRPTREAVVKEALEVAHQMVALMDRLERNPDDPAATAGLTLLRALSDSAPPAVEQLDELARTPGLDARVRALFENGRPRIIESHTVNRLLEIFRKYGMPAAPEEIAAARRRNARILALHEAGATLPAEHDLALAFYASLVYGAAEAGDRALAKKALASAAAAGTFRLRRLADLAARDPRSAEQARMNEKRIQKLLTGLRGRVASRAAGTPPPADDALTRDAEALRRLKAIEKLCYDPRREGLKGLEARFTYRRTMKSRGRTNTVTASGNLQWEAPGRVRVDVVEGKGGGRSATLELERNFRSYLVPLRLDIDTEKNNLRVLNPTQIEITPGPGSNLIEQARGLGLASVQSQVVTFNASGLPEKVVTKGEPVMVGVPAEQTVTFSYEASGTRLVLVEISGTSGRYETKVSLEYTRAGGFTLVTRRTVSLTDSRRKEQRLVMDVTLTDLRPNPRQP